MFQIRKISHEIAYLHMYKTRKQGYHLLIKFVYQIPNLVSQVVALLFFYFSLLILVNNKMTYRCRTKNKIQVRYLLKAWFHV
jgi:hypothetical protein